MRSEKYIQPDELNVDNVFENVNYVIPIYQRNSHGEKMKLSNC